MPRSFQERGTIGQLVFTGKLLIRQHRQLYYSSFKNTPDSKKS
jgi:hypothetical protein